MSWNFCQYEEFGNRCENYTARPDGEFCESHRRANESGSLMTYSEDTKDNLERFKFDFEQSCRYYQWNTKPGQS